jgi:hypothetical protein
MKWVFPLLVMAALATQVPRYYAMATRLQVPVLTYGRTEITEPTMAFDNLEALAAYRRSGFSYEGRPVEGRVRVLEFSGPAARIDAGWVDAKFLARNAEYSEVYDIDR